VWVTNVGVRAAGGEHHVVPRDRHGLRDLGVLVDAGACEMEVVVQALVADLEVVGPGGNGGDRVAVRVP
jgi:hypothetical protein